MSGTIRVVADADELAREAAIELARRAEGAIDEGRDFRLALAGGSTPRRLYSRLPPELPWRGIQLWFGDERHVPPDHPDSNYRMVRETLLERVRVPERNVHRWPAEEADAGAAARAYEEELRRGFAAPSDLLGGFPRFDLVLLGLGPDGHTASLFPGTEVLAEERRWARANRVDRLGAWRLTLTLGVLNAAAAVLFLVSGADKAEILHLVLNGAPGRYPAQRVEPRRGELKWLVDRAAATACGC